jgi:Flp pilus assembly pilin Flp
MPEPALGLTAQTMQTGRSERAFRFSHYWGEIVKGRSNCADETGTSKVTSCPGCGCGKVGVTSERENSDPLPLEANQMSRFFGWAKQLATDDAGGEVFEYAIVAGLISIAAITVIGTFGSKVLARWNSVNSSM